MVKRIYIYIIAFFSFFVITVISMNIWLYKKEASIAMSITSSYQYNFVLEETLYNKIYLIKHILDKYYKGLVKTEIKRKTELLKNDIDKLIGLLQTLKDLKFKNYKSFLFKYIFHIYNRDIEIIQNGKIIISKNLEKIGKKAKYICDPFSDYGQCSVIKNSKFYILRYSPAYKLLIESDIDLKNADNNKIAENLIMMLKTIPKIIIYYKGKKLAGNFDKNSFYIFDEYKPLNIFFGFGIEYKRIEKLSNTINNEVLKAIRPLIFLFIIIYVLIIALMYFILFTLFRKKIIFIEKMIIEYSQKATTDKLTKLLNRNGFENRAENEKCRYFLIIDLDNFKYVNDTFGHETGDMVLKEFAWLLTKYFKNDLIGRWGGDEFLICTNKEKNQIKNIIEIINTHLEKIQRQFDKKMTKKLSVSAGGCGDTRLDMQKRFNNADLALYKVKKTKKGNIMFFQDLDYIRIEREDLFKK
ncbi:GGDEF domain-containing protein [Nautilia sp.]